MNKLVATLALSTSALAVTSIYLWTELREARGQVEAMSASRTSPRHIETQVPDDEGIASTSSPVLPVAVGTSSPPDDAAKARQKLLEDEYRERSRRYLAQVNDPAMRAEMLEEMKEANRPNKSKYARHLGISEADAERLIDLLAVQDLERSESHSRCSLQPQCDYQSLFRQTSAAQQSAITDLLGAEVQRRFEEYTYSGVERNMVSNFLRDRVPPANRLDDEQAELLIAALAEVRKSVETEIRQRGAEPFLFPMEGVAFTFSGNMYEAGNTAERLEQAADFNRRILVRAKALLTPQQLAAFEQMQELAIVGLKSSLRRDERERATQAAISGAGK
jgi:hypothetical protein